eukprot:10042599-Karenia_brevis.AAC.1
MIQEGFRNFVSKGELLGDDRSETSEVSRQYQGWRRICSETMFYMATCLGTAGGLQTCLHENGGVQKFCFIRRLAWRLPEQIPRG